MDILHTVASLRIWMESFFRGIDLGTFLVFTTVFLLVLYWISVPRTDIPGPFALPVVGNLPLLFRIGIKRQQAYFQLQKKYGNIFRLFIGRRMSIVLCGYENIYDAFVNHGIKTSNRPDWLFDPHMKIKHGTLEPGMLFSSGGIWRKNRRFAVQTMRNFGMGKKSLEEVVTDEARELCADIAAYKGKPIEKIKDLLAVSVSNVIHSIVFGFRCTHDDPEFLATLDAIDTLFKAPPVPFQILPKFIQNSPGPRYEARVKAREDIADYLEKQIKEHEKNFDKNDIRDLVDKYLAEIPWEKDIKEKILMMFQVVLECFAAGTDTTATTLEWALLFMIAYPDVQDRCYEEIKKVVGLNRDIFYSDRDGLGFLEATVLEVQRLSNISSLTFPHTSSEDLVIGGHRIPKDTMISAFISSAHMDPKRFPNPDEFRPQRFYDEKTGSVVNKDLILPFSLGPRICPGETLARTELFTMLGNLIQKFKFSKVSTDDHLSFEALSGVVSYPEPFRLKAECRGSTPCKYVT